MVDNHDIIAPDWLLSGDPSIYIFTPRFCTNPIYGLLTRSLSRCSYSLMGFAEALAFLDFFARGAIKKWKYLNYGIGIEAKARSVLAGESGSEDYRIIKAVTQVLEHPISHAEKYWKIPSKFR